MMLLVLVQVLSMSSFYFLLLYFCLSDPYVDLQATATAPSFLSFGNAIIGHYTDGFTKEDNFMTS